MEAREEIADILVQLWGKEKGKKGIVRRDKHLRNLERIRKFSLCEHYGPEVDAKVKATHLKLAKEAEDRKRIKEREKSKETTKVSKPEKQTPKPKPTVAKVNKKRN